MSFLNRAAAHEIAGLTAAISYDSYYYIGVVLLVIIMLALLVHAYRVWEEIHDVEDPDSPSDLLDSFEQAHAEGELDAKELDRVRKLLLGGHGNGGQRVGTSISPGSKAGPIKDPRAIEGAGPADTSEDDARGGAE
jgi:uncharacterized membrane protein